MFLTGCSLNLGASHPADESDVLEFKRQVAAAFKEYNQALLGLSKVIVAYKEQYPLKTETVK